jgi:hypothetical protein
MDKKQLKKMNKKNGEKPRLFISLPCYDAMVTMQTMMSVMHLTNLLNQSQIEFTIDFIGNESLIPRARNNSLGRFMKSNFTHLLFIDSDIEFPAQAVMDLLKSNKDVACCAYPRKAYNWRRFMYSMSTEQQSKESLDSRGLDFTFNVYSSLLWFNISIFTNIILNILGNKYGDPYPTTIMPLYPNQSNDLNQPNPELETIRIIVHPNEDEVSIAVPLINN